MINLDSIYRQYDIRGVVGKDFDYDFGYFLGRAYAKYICERSQSQRPKICVGRDCRLTGEKIANNLMQGLSEGGCEVVYIGMVTTPITYFTLYHRDLDGCLMVTGSHNPPDYNGFKICAGKGTLYGDEIQVLRELVREIPLNSFSPKGLEYPEVDATTGYLDYLKQQFKKGFSLKVVVDAGNGSAGPVSCRLLRDLGCDVTELYCEPDGSFPNHEADPTVEANLVDLQKELAKGSFDLGLAYDGDGDRIGAVAPNGRIIWGDELLIVLARAVLEKNPSATIISEVKSSFRLYDDIRKHGGNAIMWKTGHSLIKAKIKETGALLAGEMSGHIFFSDRYYGFDDALYASCRVLEILAEKKKPIQELISDLPQVYNTPELRVECDDEKKWQVIDRLRDELKKEFTVNDIDGVRIDFKDGWALARASNTQPVIVTRFEATTKSRLDEIRSLVEGKLKAALA